MKRLLVLAGVFSLCFFMVGCGGETHEKLITDTINRMNVAATEVGNIKARVDDAVKRVVDKNEPFDLTDAIEATSKLEETGAEFERLKQRIEQVKSQVKDDERKAFAENQKAKLNTAFKSLIDNREELRKSLLEAEKHDKKAVDTFRTKLAKAEGLFVALSR